MWSTERCSFNKHTYLPRVSYGELHIYHIRILQAMTLRSETENRLKEKITRNKRRRIKIHKKGNVNLMNENLDLRLGFSSSRIQWYFQQLEYFGVVLVSVFFACSLFFPSVLNSCLPFSVNLLLLLLLLVLFSVFFSLNLIFALFSSNFLSILFRTERANHYNVFAIFIFQCLALILFR